MRLTSFLVCLAMLVLAVMAPPATAIPIKPPSSCASLSSPLSPPPPSAIWRRPVKPGARPASDFDTTHCGGGHCARRAGFLHDGRARTVLEAILWHGGEATAARTAVTALSAPDREHLLAFLTSL